MTKTAIVKGEMISEFYLLKPEDVPSLSDEDLVSRMKTGIRTFSSLLAPFAQEFMLRFKTAKKEKKEFLTYSDFDRAALALTGYTGRQIRNIAAGTPTPQPRTKLTKAEIVYRKNAKEVKARIDAGVAERRREADLKAEGDSTKTRAAVNAIVQPQYVEPVCATVLPVVNDAVAMRDANDLDSAIEILRSLVFAIDGTKKHPALTAAIKAACNFLKGHGGLPSPLPTAKKAAASKPAISRAAAIKNEPSQDGTGPSPAPAFPPFDESDKSLTRGFPVSENSKGTGVETQLVTAREFERLQRPSGLAL